MDAPTETDPFAPIDLGIDLSTFDPPNSISLYEACEYYLTGERGSRSATGRRAATPTQSRDTGPLERLAPSSCCPPCAGMEPGGPCLPGARRSSRPACASPPREREVSRDLLPSS
jgi:hypothetical protein